MSMRKKAHKQQRKLSTDTLLKTKKKKDIQLTEKELGKVSGGIKLENPNVKTEWKW
jgi:hypothetical protein